MTPLVDVTFPFDLKRAETILREVALDLRSLPRAHALHVRALTLKRIVGGWSEDSPPKAQRQRTIEELLGLQEVVRVQRAAIGRARAAAEQTGGADIHVVRVHDDPAAHARAFLGSSRPHA